MALIPEGEYIPKKKGILKTDAEKDLLEGKRRISAASQEVILNTGKNIQDPELRALYFGMYLSGGRISEMLALKQGDVNVESFKLKTDIGKEVSRRAAIFNLITLKNKKRGFRLVPSPMWRPVEVEMYEHFNNIYEHRITDIFKQTIGKNRTTARIRAWQKFNDLDIKYTVMVQDLKTKQRALQDVAFHPHLMRHFRLTHLISLYKWDSFKLMEFAGWSNLKPASIYVNLDVSNLVQAFM